MKFYTSIEAKYNSIIHSYIEDGERFTEQVDFSPTLFVDTNTNKTSGWKDVYGNIVDPIQFDNIESAREFTKKYKDVSNFRISGNTNYAVQFARDMYPDDIVYDYKQLRVAYLDIEIDTEYGYSNAQNPKERINCITVHLDGKFHVFCWEGYTTTDPNIVVHYAQDESQLLEEFLYFWTHNYPDIVTGYNCRYFDLPYIYKRLEIILGEKEAKKLSPHGTVHEESSNTGAFKGRESYFVFNGLANLDFYILYQKYLPGQRESFKLDSIAEVEIKEKKLDYSEYGSLKEFYKKDYHKFVEYNIHDVRLVMKLEDKLRLIETHVFIAYKCKINFEEAFSQIRSWDAIIHNHLYPQKICVPPKKLTGKNSQYTGAYVKEPIKGKHNWIVSYDLDSLYPHNIRHVNIGPDTKISTEKLVSRMNRAETTPETKRLLQEALNAQQTVIGKGVDAILNEEVDLSCLKPLKLTLAANGVFFRTDQESFLSCLMGSFYSERKIQKDKSLEFKRLASKEKDNVKKEQLLDEAKKYNIFQSGLKILLNSCYGAIGNEYFRLFDIDQAEAITMTGQLAVRWIANAFNKKFQDHLGDIMDRIVSIDTDSNYLNLADIVSKLFKPNDDLAKKCHKVDKFCVDVIDPFIKKSFNNLCNYTNGFPHLRMKRESICDTGIFIAKKRYILSVALDEGITEYTESKIKVTGLETVRSSSPKIARQYLKELFSIAMNGTEEQAIEFIKSFKKTFNNAPIPQISYPRTANGMEEYKSTESGFKYKKGCPIGTKAAILYNSLIEQYKLQDKYEKFMDGGKIRFVYLKWPNMLGEKVIGFINDLPEEFGLNEYIDYDHMFETAFLEPAKNVLSAIGWRAERSSSLESIFL